MKQTLRPYFVWSIDLTFGKGKVRLTKFVGVVGLDYNLHRLVISDGQFEQQGREWAYALFGLRSPLIVQPVLIILLLWWLAREYSSTILQLSLLSISRLIPLSCKSDLWISPNAVRYGPLMPLALVICHHSRLLRWWVLIWPQILF